MIAKCSKPRTRVAYSPNRRASVFETVLNWKTLWAERIQAALLSQRHQQGNASARRDRGRHHARSASERADDGHDALIQQPLDTVRYAQQTASQAFANVAAAIFADGQIPVVDPGVVNYEFERTAGLPDWPTVRPGGVPRRTVGPARSAAAASPTGATLSPTRGLYAVRSLPQTAAIGANMPLATLSR